MEVGSWNFSRGGPATGTGNPDLREVQVSLARWVGLAICVSLPRVAWRARGLVSHDGQPV
jgi:hypothetical protein